MTASQAYYNDTMKHMAALILGAVAIATVPAAAQSARSDVTDGFPLPLDLPAPADTGKPHFFVLPVVTPPPAGCAAAFDCRIRLLGAVQHNGAVELNTTVLRW
jgi:hypothetical protein